MGMSSAAKVIDGETYILTTDGSYTDANGGEWVAFEKRDMQSKIRWADRELAKLAGRDLTDYDTAALWTEIKDIQAAEEESLRIVELLFG
jgi:hypothetical protein